MKNAFNDSVSVARQGGGPGEISIAVVNIRCSISGAGSERAEHLQYSSYEHRNGKLFMATTQSEQKVGQQCCLD